VSLDFGQLGFSSGLVTAISVGPPSNAPYYERRHLGEATYLFGSFSFEATTPAAADPPLPEDEADRLVHAAAGMQDPLTPEQEAQLQSLLADKRDFVRVNAARALTRVRVPACVAALADLTRSANEWVAEVALEALAFQDSDESWRVVRGCLEAGPFDFTRALAARTILARPEPKLASPFSFLLTARNWRHRATGAHCLAALPGREAAIILMSFLRDLDPCVRMAVIRGANPDFDLVCRRLLQAAVNDPSEEARATALCKLAGSPIAEYQAEGAKGVREDSPYVRLALLEWMRGRGMEQDRGAIRLAVTDPMAEVRAAALRAFAALPGPVELAEIANVLSDSDPRVQRELIALVRAKGLALDAATKAQLAGSVDAEVARLARGLGQ
jgi:HEAT repeat protein